MQMNFNNNQLTTIYEENRILDQSIVEKNTNKEENKKVIEVS